MTKKLLSKTICLLTILILGSFLYSSPVLATVDNYSPQCPATGITVPSPTTTTGYSYVFEQSIPGIVKAGQSIDNTGVSGLARKIIQFLFSIAGLLALVMIIWAGVQYTLSAGNATVQKDARGRITEALLGLLLLFASYIILNTINPDLLRLKEPSLSALAPGGPGGEGNNNQPLNLPHGTPVSTASLPQEVPNQYTSQSGFTGNLAKCINDSLKNYSGYDDTYVCNTWTIAMYQCAGRTLPNDGATNLYYNDAQPITGEPQFGDFVFWCNPDNEQYSNCAPNNGSNHIGVYVGKSSDGKMLVAQCGYLISNNGCQSQCPCIMEINDIPTWGGRSLKAYYFRRP